MAFRTLQVVVFDVDGVFTDGKTWQDPTGQWRRSFSVRDTMGVRALRKAGVRVVVLTPALSTEIRAHFEKIGVDDFRDHCLDNEAAVEQILRAHGLAKKSVAYVSENKAGEVALRLGETVIYTAAKQGGDGAVLEICNLILQHEVRELSSHG